MRRYQYKVVAPWPRPIVLALAGTFCLASAAVIGCQATITPNTNVPVASPQAGGDQGGVVNKPTITVPLSQPNEQTATAGPVSVPGNGNTTVVVPVNLNGSAWGIIALAAGVAALAWLAHRQHADVKAGKAIARGIGQLPAAARIEALARIAKEADKAGVRQQVTKLAERAGSRVHRHESAG